MPLRAGWGIRRVLSSGSDFGWDEILSRSGGRSRWTNWLTPSTRLSEPTLKRAVRSTPQKTKSRRRPRRPAPLVRRTRTTESQRIRLFFFPGRLAARNTNRLWPRTPAFETSVRYLEHVRTCHFPALSPSYGRASSRLVLRGANENGVVWRAFSRR
jgi:hypothetical protein